MSWTRDPPGSSRSVDRGAQHIQSRKASKIQVELGKTKDSKQRITQILTHAVGRWREEAKWEKNRVEGGWRKDLLGAQDLTLGRVARRVKTQGQRALVRKRQKRKDEVVEKAEGNKLG